MQLEYLMIELLQVDYSMSVRLKEKVFYIGTSVCMNAYIVFSISKSIRR